MTTTRNAQDQYDAVATVLVRNTSAVRGTIFGNPSLMIHGRVFPTVAIGDAVYALSGFDRNGAAAEYTVVPASTPNVERDAVLAFPAGQLTVGRAAIPRVYERMLASAPRLEAEDGLPTLRSGDLALTSTRRRDGKGIRVQVARRQPAGTWLRVFDWPEPPSD